MEVGQDVERDVAPEEKAAQVEHQRDATDQSQNAGPILLSLLLLFLMNNYRVVILPTFFLSEVVFSR